MKIKVADSLLFTGEDAEMLALRFGVRDMMVANCQTQKPETAEEVINHTCAQEGIFITLTLYHTGAQSWFAIIGDQADATGKAILARHNATKVKVHVPTIGLPEPENN